MGIVAYANASGGTYPGHMVIGEEVADGESSYFGYRFDVADLPADYRNAARWREYLFTHPVPGNIVDETAYVRALIQEKGGTYYTKRAECSVSIATILPAENARRHHAFYSFNPDDFHSDETPCYNCVTWATRIGNLLVVGFLIPVRQGRVKEIILQLQAVSTTQEPNDG
jgi:hypothetical protein